MKVITFSSNLPSEVFLACKQLLQKQDAGSLEEVWLSQGT